MSSIADLRAFLMSHKLPKMTSKKSVLMDAAIERGWKPSGVSKEESDSDSVASVPVKKTNKKVLETRIEPKKKLSKQSEEPVFKSSRTTPAGKPKKDIQKPTIERGNIKSRREVE